MFVDLIYGGLFWFCLWVELSVVFVIGLLLVNFWLFGVVLCLLMLLFVLVLIDLACGCFDCAIAFVLFDCVGMGFAVGLC